MFNPWYQATLAESRFEFNAALAQYPSAQSTQVSKGDGATRQLATHLHGVLDLPVAPDNWETALSREQDAKARLGHAEALVRDRISRKVHFGENEPNLIDGIVHGTVRALSDIGAQQELFQIDPERFVEPIMATMIEESEKRQLDAGQAPGRIPMWGDDDGFALADATSSVDHLGF